MQWKIPQTCLLALACAGVMSCSVVQAARADYRPPAPEGHDHDRARQALDRGEIRPLADILALATRAVPGEVIEVEFDQVADHDQTAWRYELKILTEDGRMREVQIDATMGQILTVEDE